MTPRPALARAQAEALAAELELGLEIPICYACLSFVSMALDLGDMADAVREARKMTPYLWDEGLAEPALAAVRRACDRGVPHAREGWIDLEQRGGRSVVAQAIVLRLAAELSRRVHTEAGVMWLATERDRSGRARPELN